MKKIRIFTFGLCLVMLMFTLCSCGQIEDTNGADDHSLNTITDEELVKEGGISSSSVGSVKTHINDKFKISVKKFSGVSDVYDFYLDSGESITLDFETELKSGNIRIFVFSDGKIIKDIPVGEKNSYTCNEAGDYSVRVAGESAEFTLMING